MAGHHDIVSGDADAWRCRAAGSQRAGAPETSMTEGNARTPQFLRYAGAGAVGTAVHYSTLVALVQAGLATPVVGSTLGATGGALVNYALNHRYTFASRRAHAQALPRFAAVALAGIALNAAVLAAMLTLLSAHYLVAQVVATLAVLAFGFLANRRWTF
jgi:putative flippase GtrA